jgi:hypothetical protein
MAHRLRVDAEEPLSALMKVLSLDVSAVELGSRVQ